MCSTVLGSYAHFMWEAEEEEEVNGGVTEETAMEMVAAFWFRGFENATRVLNISNRRYTMIMII